MGLFDFMFQDDTEEDKAKPKNKKRSGLFDFMFEQEKEDEVSFADSDAIDDINETIPGKIQAKKIELKTFGIVLNSINPEEFSGAKTVISEYIKLLDRIKELEILSRNEDSENVMQRIELERKYAEFEREYDRQIPAIKNLYWLSELKKQNNNMKNDFNKPVSEISQCKIDDYYKYIKTISSRKNEFNEQYKNELVSALLIAEYRLKMLMLMRNVCKERQNGYNPFEHTSESKKKRFEEMFLEDVSEASSQYESVCNLKGIYLKSGALDKSDFSELEELSDNVLNNISQDVIDDFSISDIFERRETSTLEDFVRLKAQLNYMKSQFNEIDLDKKPRKKSRNEER